MHLLSRVRDGGNPAADHYVATIALGRRAHLTSLVERGSIGLEPAIITHEETLRLIAERYGHDKPFCESLLRSIPVTN